MPFVKTNSAIFFIFAVHIKKEKQLSPLLEIECKQETIVHRY